jgi:hypothetical protein
MDEITALPSEGKDDLRAEAKARQLVAETLSIARESVLLLERLLRLSDQSASLAGQLSLIEGMAQQIDDGYIYLRPIMADVLRGTRQTQRTSRALRSN